MNVLKRAKRTIPPGPIYFRDFMEILKKLTVVMFYASIPLFIPFFYSTYFGDEAYVSIGITIILLAFFAIPEVIRHMIFYVGNFIQTIFRKEIPWNYAEIIHFKSLRKEVEMMTLGEMLVLTALAWLIIPVITSIPYYLHGFLPLDALFESFSGWTTTGLSSVKSVDTLPKSLILFRSITQWIGGLGIIILMVSVLRGREAADFLKAEGRTSTEIGIGKTIGLIWKTYLFLTILGIVLLYVFGMKIFNSVNLAMAGISTGGFFPFDSYDFTDEQKFILAGLMFMGATSFLFFKYLSKLQFRKAFLDEEFLLYVGVAVVAFILIVAIGHENPHNTFLNSISSLASGGFAIGDVAVMHNFAKYLLILLMLSGGMSGSTTGGIKLWRVVLVLKSIIHNIKSSFLPRGTVQLVKMNGSPVKESVINEASIYVFFYTSLFLFASGVFIAFNYTIVDSLFVVASAMGTVGLTTIPLYEIGDLTKVFLMILMYLGRIEIFPSLALLAFIGGMAKK